ncbi:hypothetical protein [Dysgonomonas sp. ZJ279]|uniref:hypothetical protein n=1 Tax=Dysgonomonas sp. ZJ279 TaxID=2709796 RepID=UPI0013EBB7CA|nr:hypothetical protein [Dysgonomonas sp. ZJ279]
MKTSLLTKSVYFSLLAFLPVLATAQDKLSANLGADLVSSYVWRGIKQGGGASIQPALNASYKNFTLGAWGSTDLGNSGAKEIDFYTSYENSGFKFLITDYWWDSEAAFRYFSAPTGGNGHYLELTASYSFAESFPLSVSWNTFVLGKGNKKDNGNNSYSTYIEFAYPFTIDNLEMGISTGFTPWSGAVYNTDGFEFTSIQLSALKNIKITDKITLPIFSNLIANPAHEDIHFVFGIKIN